jgi:preprotein translocase SecE subunit
MIKAITEFSRGVVTEVKRVQWPTLPTVAKYFIAVVVGVALATLFIGLVDLALYQGLALLTGRFMN